MLKFDPSVASAWQNVIQGLIAPKPTPGNLPLLKAGMLATPSLNASAPRKVPFQCAIPLTRLPADLRIDPGMRLDLKADAQSFEHMPHAKSMPVCPEQPPER